MSTEPTRTAPFLAPMSRLAALLVLASSGGCGWILGIDDGQDLSVAAPGYLYYTTDTSGVVEIWAIDELDRLPVRITDGESRVDEPSPWFTYPSWDGSKIAVSSLRASDGSFDGNRHLWVMDPDGANPTYLSQTNPGTAFYGLSWAGDSVELFYSDDEPCSNNILRIDSRSPGSEVIVYDVDGIAAEPRANPADGNQILFMEQECGEVGTLKRLDVAELTVQPIEAVIEQQGRFRFTSFSHDGERFAYASGATVYVHDFSAEAVVYTDGDDASRFGPPVFGRDDAMLYVKWCSGEDVCDLLAIDVETGTAESLGVPDIRSDSRTAPHIGWSPGTVDIDQDDDGIANGIDADFRGGRHGGG